MTIQSGNITVSYDADSVVWTDTREWRNAQAKEYELPYQGYYYRQRCAGYETPDETEENIRWRK